MPIRVKQYRIIPEARDGIKVHIQCLYEAGQPAWNLKDHRPVPDSREVNKRVESIFPTVPNPYTWLSLLPPEHEVYTVLDLKDAFFSFNPAVEIKSAHLPI